LKGEQGLIFRHRHSPKKTRPRLREGLLASTAAKALKAVPVSSKPLSLSPACPTRRNCHAHHNAEIICLGAQAVNK
jgi:hypothetical protein